VINLLADANIQGQIDYLEKRAKTGPWGEFWSYLDICCLSFSQVDLDVRDSDSIVWQRCQERQIFLLTNNRNDDGPDSLEATIRNHNTPQSLPVFTIGDAERILQDKDYCERVTKALLEHLLQIDNIRGTGRLFLP
jgi:hypothetical protein